MVATAGLGHRNTVLFGFRQLLSTIHQGLLTSSQATDGFNQEKRKMDMVE